MRRYFSFRNLVVLSIVFVLFFAGYYLLKEYQHNRWIEESASTMRYNIHRMRDLREGALILKDVASDGEVGPISKLKGLWKEKHEKLIVELGDEKDALLSRLGYPEIRHAGTKFVEKRDLIGHYKDNTNDVIIPPLSDEERLYVLDYFVTMVCIKGGNFDEFIKIDPYAIGMSDVEFILKCIVDDNIFRTLTWPAIITAAVSVFLTIIGLLLHIAPSPPYRDNVNGRITYHPSRERDAPNSSLGTTGVSTNSKNDTFTEDLIAAIRKTYDEW